MSFSINTNITSLQAQNSLRTTSNFQSNTINKVTSGLRIVQSGDDAAGLAIANGLRSDQAVLTQGVRNANDGLSTLQTVDSGMSNISTLLDRARTLATQSASGTFTGDRSVLNSEFQSVVGEIDRQSQAIGLNTGGQFAKSLSVFVGGGKTSGTTTSISNGSVNVDLSSSTVDAKSLGLKGVQAVSTGDLRASGSTSVQSIVGDSVNQASESTKGYTEFDFAGAGFSGASKVKVSVNLSGVTDTDTLVAAVNTAIQNAGNGTAASATAFKNANVTAVKVTDATTGAEHIAFASSSSAFQVAAGDLTSNALLGKTGSSTATGHTAVTGNDLATTVTAGSTFTGATAFANNQNVIIRIQGAGMSKPEDITLNLMATDTGTTAIANLNSQIAANANLQAAGITLDSTGTSLKFSNSQGQTFSVEAAGDTGNVLGLGSASLATANGGSFDYTTITGAVNAPAAGTTDLQFSIGGTTVDASITTTTTTNAGTVDAINAKIGSNATLKAAGLVASTDGTHITIASSNGTDFRLNLASADGAGTGLGVAGVDLTAGGGATYAQAVTASKATVINSAGATATADLGFTGIALGSDKQTLTVSANNANGVAQQTDLTLDNTNARSIDEAVSSINSQLQKSNNSTLKNIVAVKDESTGTDKIKFVSTDNSFSVSVGTTASGNTGITGDGTFTQGHTYAGVADATGGSTADISNASSASAAVTALSAAVTTLGAAQAVVGKGENVLNYAVNLAQSQLTNEASAESRIRDADLANEAANLTKAQILMQAGVAALAQANSAPQQILSLLKG